MLAHLNGIDLAYTDAGQGPPLLFIHGFPLCGAAWSRQIPAFQASHRVLVPDLRGLGASPSGPGRPSIAGYAEDLQALLEHLELPQATLIGHSMGGYVALAMARAHPETLRGLVLVATRAGADSPDAARKRLELAARVRAEGIGPVLQAMAPTLVSPSNPDPTLAAAVLAFMTASQPEGVAGALEAMADRPDASADLATIQVPTLVLAGAADKVIDPQESVTMPEQLGDATLTLIPGAGHLVAFEAPDAFNAALRGWLPAPV